MIVATHSGPFHADDVFACALLRCFVNRELRIIRTRDLDQIARADAAVDVGGEFDPARQRFDHHQSAYEGPRSSAGMVLDWLLESDRIEDGLGRQLREEWVEYIDAVDNGRRQPDTAVPCWPTLVGSLAENANTVEEFDPWFERAVAICIDVIDGICNAREQAGRARSAVLEAMETAVTRNSRVVRLDRHYKWKDAYFDLGGAEHPTHYVLFPEGESCRVIAIPPDRDSFDKKRPFPRAWAGLVDDELSQVVGVPGARFCHKNLFIAVFESVEAAEAALVAWDLD